MTIKVLKRLLFIFILFVTLSYFMSGCFSFRMSKKQTREYFEGLDPQPELVEYEANTWTMNYARVGADSLPIVIFLHGAPGSWSAFKHFMNDPDLLARAQVISVDRPGYGHSNFGRPETSLEKQAALIIPILKKSKSERPAILVGHSLGGPVIARMAMDFPELVGGLVLVAPSIDPELEPEEWYRLPLNTPFVRWILPTSFDMTNREIYHLKYELELMLPLWKNITAPATVIQGSEDNLVHPGNADFAKKMLTSSEVSIELLDGVNHFIPWNNPDIIKQAILKHLDLLNQETVVRLPEE